MFNISDVYYKGYVVTPTRVGTFVVCDRRDATFTDNPLTFSTIDEALDYVDVVTGSEPWGSVIKSKG